MSKMIYPAKDEYQAWLDTQMLDAGFDMYARRNDTNATRVALVTAIDADRRGEFVRVSHYLPNVCQFAIRSRRPVETLRRAIERDGTLRVLEMRGYERNGTAWVNGLVWRPNA